MKKVLLTLALAATAISSSFAQGFVLFNNGTTTKISTNSVVGGAATATTQSGGSYYYALLYSSTATTVSGSATAISGTGNYAFSDSAWKDGAVTGTNSGTAAGRFLSAQADSVNNSGGSPVTGTTAGNAYQFVVIGWSGNIGSTLASVEAWYNGGQPTTAGFIGESIVSGSITTGAGGATTPPGIFGTSAGLITGFTLGLVTPVASPEPTTIALAGLGGLALLGLRRKK